MVKFILIDKYNICHGIFRTFEDAYDEIRKANNELVEEVISEYAIRYYSYSKTFKVMDWFTIYFGEEVEA